MTTSIQRNKQTVLIQAKTQKVTKMQHKSWKANLPKTAELNVLTTPKCDVGCPSCKNNVRNELCNVWLMIFYNIEVATRMPQI